MSSLMTCLVKELSRLAIKMETFPAILLLHLEYFLEISSTFLRSGVAAYLYTYTYTFLSKGGSPYPGMEVLELIDKLESGYRMEKPRHAADEV